jgi:solute carrier family 32 (vesicular inhibitory amino acid transporter)
MMTEQISQNLLRVPGYNPALNKLALWMLVLTPLYVKTVH